MKKLALFLLFISSVTVFLCDSVALAKQPMVDDVIIPSKKFAANLSEITGGKLVPGINCKSLKAPTISCVLLNEFWMTPNRGLEHFGRQFYMKRTEMALEAYQAMAIPAQVNEIPETREVVSVKFLSVMDPYMGEIGLICGVVVDRYGTLVQSLCTLFSETTLE